VTTVPVALFMLKFSFTSDNSQVPPSLTEEPYNKVFFVLANFKFKVQPLKVKVKLSLLPEGVADCGRSLMALLPFNVVTEILAPSLTLRTVLFLEVMSKCTTGGGDVGK
jgi:hypothetical protein